MLLAIDSTQKTWTMRMFLNRNPFWCSNLSRGCSVGVDVQLPKLDVAGSIPVSRSLVSRASSLPEFGAAQYAAHSSQFTERGLERIYRIDPAFQRCLGIDIHIHVQRMPLLIGDELRIDIRVPASAKNAIAAGRENRPNPVSAFFSFGLM